MRKQHMKDLIKLLLKDKEAGDTLLVWGDMNKDINNDKNTGIKILINKVGLVQAYNKIHNHIP